MPKFISDEEMQALENKGTAKPAFISDQEMKTLEHRGATGGKGDMLRLMAESALSGVKKVGQFINEEIDKPSRRMVGLPETGEAFEKTDVGQKYEAAKNFLGKNAPAPHGMAGLLNLLPYIPAGASYEATASPLNLIGPGLKVGGAVAEEVGPTLVKYLSKRASTSTGIPAKVIETYINRTKEVDALIAKHGGDVNAATEALQEKLGNSIRGKIAKEQGRAQIALESHPQTKNVDANQVIHDMQAAIPGRVGDGGSIPMASKLNPGPVHEVEGLIDNVIKQSGGAKNVSLEDIDAIKKYLQQVASGSYTKDGQMFSVSDLAQRAAKQGARTARLAGEGVAPAEHIAANRELEKLHKLEERLKNAGAGAVITPGKPTGAITSAGAGTNPRVKSILQRIGIATETDPVREAENLAAIQYFSDPGLLPTDPNGKAAARMMKSMGFNMGSAAAGGGILGMQVGGGTGAAVGGAIGAGSGLIASLVETPAMLKKMIRLKMISEDAVKALAEVPVVSTPMTDNVVLKAFDRIQTPRGEEFLKQALKEAASKEKEQGPFKRRKDAK